jgi:hypothetical protein
LLLKFSRKVCKKIICEEVRLQSTADSDQLQLFHGIKEFKDDFSETLLTPLVSCLLDIDVQFVDKS